jgi:hypothetical protein
MPTAAWIATGLACALFAVWAALALHFQGPPAGVRRRSLVAAWLLFAAAVIAALRTHPLPAIALYLLAALLLLAWWRRIRPARDSDWADEVAQLATGRVDGDRIVVDHVRDFVWRTTTDYDVRWQPRAYALDRLCSVDLILSYWGRPGIAHTLVSFGFADGEQLVFSIEIRKQRGEAFSEIGGFFRQFEVSLIAADERDIVYLRTNVRGEDCYLYRIHLPEDARRALLLAYVAEANRLAVRPRFYNSLTNNCTTVVYRMLGRILGDLPLDVRLLFSGLLPSYIHRLGGLTPEYTPEVLRERGRITQRALDAGRAEDFSRQIRQGVPGVDPV